MSTQTSRNPLRLAPHGTDYTLSSFLGLSSSVVSTLFFSVLFGLKVAELDLSGLGGGGIFSGDPTVFYMAIFLVSASLLLVVQHHFYLKKEAAKEREKFQFD